MKFLALIFGSKGCYFGCGKFHLGNKDLVLMPTNGFMYSNFEYQSFRLFFSGKAKELFKTPNIEFKYIFDQESSALTKSITLDSGEVVKLWSGQIIKLNNGKEIFNMPCWLDRHNIDTNGVPNRVLRMYTKTGDLVDVTKELKKHEELKATLFSKLKELEV